MADTEKKSERDEKLRAYGDLVKSLASYRPTASSIFESLSKARLDERNATSSRLARTTLFGEDPQAALPEEFSDKVISGYFASAGDLYGAAATDYVVISDLAMAFKYFSKAARHCATAAELGAEDAPELLEKARQYKHTAAIVRHKLARKSILRRRLSLGLLARPR